MNADALRGTLTGNDGRRPTVEGAEERAARLLDLADFWAERWGRQADRSVVLYKALRRAHACATLRDDGTCDGCFVSEALTAPSDVGRAPADAAARHPQGVSGP